MCPPHTPVAPAPEFVGKSGAKDEVKNDPEYGDWVYQGDHMLGQHHRRRLQPRRIRHHAHLQTRQQLCRS
jgi:hypothetical protein